ncbi:MAG: DUF2256 and DUF3253 domain-containing protein [Myxococcota bacterium]
MEEKRSKICARCGRVMEWRKKWERNWESVRYCSTRCRKTRPSPNDDALESSILSLLDRRGSGKTICPSEAARQVFPEGWREHMEDSRRAARRLVARGEIVITQNGHIVDPSTAKGPIRLRRVNI